ncbi:MAG: peptide ABC transporter substrate-binding protein [Gammaproteobacteria bacterium]
MKIILLLTAALSLLAACSPDNGVGADGSRGPASTTVLHRGNGTEPQSLDIHKSEAVSSSTIQRDLYEGLVSQAPDGSLEPGAAASWEISEDGLRYLFHLREDGRWSNGDPVTAQDFVFALRRGVDPDTLSNYSGLLIPILNAQAISAGRLPPDSLGVEAVDDKTLRITLANPSGYFLELLTHSMSYPLHRASAAQWPGAFARPDRLVSNGAYMLDDWVMQSHVKLVRNPHYRDREDLRIHEVYYYPIENPAAELKRYRAGDLDWTSTVPHNQIKWIRENLGDQFKVSPYLGIYFFGFNLERPPFRDQPGLRRALAMAVDRSIITEHLTGGGELPAYTFVPRLPGYSPLLPAWAEWPRERQVAEAQRLYAEAGYGPERPLEVEILYNTSDNHRQMALAVAAMWKQTLGVRTRIINQEFKVFLATRRSKAETEIYRAGWIGDFTDPVNFLDILRSDNGRNDTGYADPDYDGLLDRAAAAVDPERRMRLLSEAEALMLEQQPVIPLYFYVTRRLVKPWVKGWQGNVLDANPTRHFYIDDDSANQTAQEAAQIE